jgi:hypothetical protein
LIEGTKGSSSRKGWDEVKREIGENTKERDEKRRMERRKGME